MPGAPAPSDRRVALNSRRQPLLERRMGPEHFTPAHGLARWTCDAGDPDRLALGLGGCRGAVPVPPWGSRGAGASADRGGECGQARCEPAAARGTGARRRGRGAGGHLCRGREAAVSAAMVRIRPREPGPVRERRPVSAVPAVAIIAQLHKSRYRGVGPWAQVTAPGAGSGRPASDRRPWGRRSGHHRPVHRTGRDGQVAGDPGGRVRSRPVLP